MILISILVVVFVLGGTVCYLMYDKAGAYLVEETVISQMTQEIIAQTGIDLSETGRVLTEEETESFKSVLNTKVEDKEQEEVVQSKPNQEVGKTGDESIEVSSELNKPVTTDDVRGAVEQQAKEIANSIPSKDKGAMLNLVISNLTSSDMNYLMSLVLDGVSGSDLAEAKRIAKERFDKEELERVKGYYNAYSYLIP